MMMTKKQIFFVILIITVVCTADVSSARELTDTDQEAVQAWPWWTPIWWRRPPWRRQHPSPPPPTDRHKSPSPPSHHHRPPPRHHRPPHHRRPPPQSTPPRPPVQPPPMPTPPPPTVQPPPIPTPPPGKNVDPDDCSTALIYVDGCVSDLITSFFEENVTLGGACCHAILGLSDECFKEAFAQFEAPNFTAKVRGFCARQQ